MLNKVFSDYNWKTVKGTIHGIEYDLEFPEHWESDSINIVSSKFFRISEGKQETSFKQVVTRICNTIKDWGIEQKYFEDTKIANSFADKLAKIIIEQAASFNSPVWFNIGIEKHPQLSACFILGVEDSLESIFDTIVLESKIFKGGSGSGLNISNLRSSYDRISSGGFSSGPVSFMQAMDSTAGSIKSGGATRRAASIRILNIDHPDILELKNGAPGFITCKMEEDKKCKFLVQHGFSNDFDKGVYAHAQYQNSNNSVGISDAFMKAVENDEEWSTVNKLGQIVKTYKAKFLLDKISESTNECGDPGLLYLDTINKFNPIPNTRIEASNPCSEFMNVAFTSCNLASQNLMYFYDKKNKNFNWSRFEEVIEIIFIAQDIIINKAFYPDSRITENSKKYRPIGMGYTNLGSLFVNTEHPYGSVESCNITELITAFMHFKAFQVSEKLAKNLGGLDAKINDRVNEIVRIQISNCQQFLNKGFNCNISNAAEGATKLNQMLGELKDCEFRNCQVTLLAPTGCLTLKSSVQTESGNKTMLEICEEQGYSLQYIQSVPNGTWLELKKPLTVKVASGAYQNVTKLFINGSVPTIRITANKGQIEEEGTHDHKFLVKNGNVGVWKSLVELKKGDKLVRITGFKS